MLYIAVISAVATTVFAILGLVTAIKLTWLGKYSVCQTIHGLMLVSMGGYGAERVRGCETEFGRLGAGTMTYYNVIYYGNVAQAAYGFLLITLSLAFAAIIPACEDIGFGRPRQSELLNISE
jgi:peptidoglycan/LPS O-acetylase OafA/YrhL